MNQKKIYNAPTVRVVEIEPSQVIAASAGKPADRTQLPVDRFTEGGNDLKTDVDGWLKAE